MYSVQFVGHRFCLHRHHVHRFVNQRNVASSDGQFCDVMFGVNCLLISQCCCLLANWLYCFMTSISDTMNIWYLAVKVAYQNVYALVFFFCNDCYSCVVKTFIFYFGDKLDLSVYTSTLIFHWN